MLTMDRILLIATLAGLLACAIGLMLCDDCAVVMGRLPAGAPVNRLLTLIAALP